MIRRFALKLVDFKIKYVAFSKSKAKKSTCVRRAKIGVDRTA